MFDYGTKAGYNRGVSDSQSLFSYLKNSFHWRDQMTNHPVKAHVVIYAEAEDRKASANLKNMLALVIAVVLIGVIVKFVLPFLWVAISGTTVVLFSILGTLIFGSAATSAFKISPEEGTLAIEKYAEKKKIEKVDGEYSAEDMEILLDAWLKNAAVGIFSHIILIMFVCVIAFSKGYQIFPVNILGFLAIFASLYGLKRFLKSRAESETAEKFKTFRYRSTNTTGRILRLFTSSTLALYFVSILLIKTGVLQQLMGLIH